MRGMERMGIGGSGWEGECGDEWEREVCLLISYNYSTAISGQRYVEIDSKTGLKLSTGNFQVLGDEEERRGHEKCSGGREHHT